MAVCVTDVIVVILAWPRVNGTEVAEPVIFASSEWTSASTDTPASTPAISTFAPRSLSLETEWWRQGQDGLLMFGGAQEQTTLPVQISNPRSETDNSKPLDPVGMSQGYQWSDARAEIWSAQAGIDGHGGLTLQVALAAMTRRFSMVVESLSAGEGDATLSLRHPNTMEKEATPFALRGWGYSARTPITRPDRAELRATSSFVFRLIYRVSWLTGGAETMLDLPLLRLRRTLDLVGVVEIRNAAGTWQGFASITLPTTYKDFHVTFDSATNAARLFLEGVFTEEITVTGGLYASAGAQSAQLLSMTGGNSLHWNCAGIYWLAATRDDDFVTNDSRHGVSLDPDMVWGFTFDEAIGARVRDLVDLESGTVTEPWAATGEGDEGWAERRLPACFGLTFGVPVKTYHASDRIVVAGYSGGGGGFRHLTEDGYRLRPVTTDPAIFRTIAGDDDSIRPYPGSLLSIDVKEFAPGQAIVRGPPGANPTNMVVKDVSLDPILGSAEQLGFLRTSTDLVNESATITLDNASGETDWSDTFQAAVGRTFAGATLSITPQGILQASYRIRDNLGYYDPPLTAALERFGDEASPASVEYERPGSATYQHGWMVDGEQPARELFDRVALSALSVDDGPMGVYFSPSGALAVRGMRLDADPSDDIAVPEHKIRDIVPVTLRAKPRRVKIHYAQAWDDLDVAQSLGVTDALARELRRRWRFRTAGSGDSVGSLETSLLRPDDARRKALAVLRLQGFEVFAVELYAPVDDSTLQAALGGPFLQTTLTWRRDAFWAGGRVAWTVGYRMGVDTLTLFVTTEVGA